MRRILDVRIVRWQLKLVYVVAAIVMIFAITAFLHALGVAEMAEFLLGALLDFTALLYGARVFRGRGEAIEPRRPWWRMTARPTLSRRLGILFLVLALVALAGLVLAAFGMPEPGPTVPIGPPGFVELLVLAQYGGFAFLYLNSAIRLKRLGVPPKEPKFRPPMRLRP